MSYGDREALWEICANEHRYVPQSGDRVLDIGANKGFFSLYCATRGALVTAYEPDPDTFKELVTQVEVAQKCGGTKITPYKAAVWSESGERLLWRDPQRPETNSMLRPGVYSVMVRTVSLTQALAGKFWQCVKVDVEGAEAQIFLNAKREDMRLIGYLTMELHSGVLTLDQNNALLERLRLEFPRVDAVPELVNEVPTGRTAKVFCRNVC